MEPRHRLLGRGIPPSQPAPQHVAPASLESAERPKPPPPVVIAAAIALATIVVLGTSAVLWSKFFSPKPEKPALALAEFVREATSAKPIDIALATDDDLRMKTDIVTIERVWMDTCQRSGPGRTPPEKCDRQPFFERAVVKAIVENGGCAPERPKDESISYALEVQYRTRKTRLFVGKSGSLRAADAKAAVACIERALPEADWENLPHDHTRYVIGVLATYPGEKRQ